MLTVTLVISYATLVFGELVPKRLGLQRAERVAVAVSGPVTWLERAFAPLVWLLTVSTTAVARLMGLKTDGGRPGVSEEEIKLLVTEQGSLLDEEKRMIHEIFELGDTVAREIMVPRVDMVLAEDTATVAHAASVMQGTGFSRLPIFHEDHDKIVGVVLLKDLVAPLSTGAGDELGHRAHARAGLRARRPRASCRFSRRCARHATRWRSSSTSTAVPRDSPRSRTSSRRSWARSPTSSTATTATSRASRTRCCVVDGRLSIEEALERGLPVEESDEYETVAGWMLAKLGHIPVPGERYERKGYQFRIQTMRRSRIARIRVTAEAPLDDQPGAEHHGLDLRARVGRARHPTGAASCRVSPQHPRRKPGDAIDAHVHLFTKPLMMEIVDRPETPKRFKQAAKEGKWGRNGEMTLPDLSAEEAASWYVERINAANVAKALIVSVLPDSAYTRDFIRAANGHVHALCNVDPRDPGAPRAARARDGSRASAA